MESSRRKSRIEFMKASALQEFLRNLGGSLAAVGVPPKSLDDLRAVAHTLEPFRELDLEQLADFLRRAGEYRRTGEVPAISASGLDQAAAAARSLGEAVQALDTSDDAAAAQVEARIIQGRRDLQSALGTLAGRFGVAVKFTEDKKWLPDLRARSATARVVEAFRRLASQINRPESYQSDTVKSAVDDLAETDSKVLKMAAAELGVSGTGTGKKFVESVLVKLTGIDNKPAKATKKAKPEEPVASDEQVDSMTRTLRDMVTRAKDPNAVPDSEIDAILSRVSAEFSTDQQKAIAKQVTGNGGRSARDAVNRLRADLTAVRRLLESQRV
jgi:hypothetical protein